MPPKQSPQIKQLRNLAADPQAQAEYAVTLLVSRYGRQVILAALGVLAEVTYPQARNGLLKLYEHYAARGVQRDPGTYTRSVILRAMRYILEPADLELMLQAVNTYEYPPPEFQEDGVLLRAAALHNLAGLDDHLARYHAARLLFDEHTQPMSGEPALTAAKLLAAQSELLSIYAYVSQLETRLVPEVASECISQLTTLPEELIPGLIAQHRDTSQMLVLVGLFDLLIHHKTGPHGLEFLAEFLQTTDNEDAFRYLTTTAVASGNPALITLLIESARFEQRRGKLQMLVGALSLLSGSPEIEELVRQLEERLA